MPQQQKFLRSVAINWIFFLFTQKEDFAHQVITAPRAVIAQCHALQEPTATWRVSQRAPAVPQDITVPKWLAILLNSPVPMVSTVPMVTTLTHQQLSVQTL